MDNYMIGKDMHELQMRVAIVENRTRELEERTDELLNELKRRQEKTLPDFPERPAQERGSEEAPRPKPTIRPKD